MVNEHNKKSKNVIGRIVWAVGPNEQNELFLPIENVGKTKKWVGLSLNIKNFNLFYQYTSPGDTIFSRPSQINT